MLTLERFVALADAYGADLRRWPEDLRAEAEALVTVSAQARARLDEAGKLDQFLAAVSADRDLRLWPPGGQEAALARLRSGVEGRIAWSEAHGGTNQRGFSALLQSFSSARGLPFHWIVAAASGGFAMIAGFLLGATYMSAPISDVVLAMLQPAPIHILAF